MDWGDKVGGGVGSLIKCTVLYLENSSEWKQVCMLRENLGKETENMVLS